MSTTLDLSELDAKIGQLFMIGIPGPQLDESTEALIRDCSLGGVILFSRNIEDPIQLTRLCLDLQDVAIEHHGLPLILAVDQEGGRVARLRDPFAQFPGNTAIGQDKEPEKKAEEFGRITAEEMKMVGLNMNLAPVVDVQRGEPEKHLAGRTFGEDPAVVALLGRTVVRSLQENGILAVAKHFPGLGRTRLDPHVHLPRIELDMKEMEEVNLPPFQAAINEGVSGIMTSHAIYPAMDTERPATLSPVVLTQLLRERMGFEGLIITDDLEMGAIAEHWGVAEGAAAAFEAGADILLICEDQKNVLGSLELIRSKLLQNKIPFQRLNASHERILKVRSILLDRKEWISLGNVKRYFKLSA
ncbi:MAG: beta-N-acetylhexosaminidase [Desulfobacteraceae bacterium]|nr:beta-N-acetylhexosaminidase [Desulfobacteraceae bacterium]